ncbi:MAG: chemotaxis protein CheW [Firmicutes bacterium]|nr:chemotaxis protein CheW [Bacillota bacterium]
MNEAQIVVFSLDGLPFGASAEEVEEVVEYSILQGEYGNSENKMPYMEGYTNVRGNMIPVVNLGKYLGLEGTTVPDDPKIILARANKILVGFAVNNVSRILRLKGKAIQDTPRIITTPENACIKKFAIDGELLFPIIHLESVLPEEALRSLSGT